jgi:hypothetical protein
MLASESRTEIVHSRLLKGFLSYKLCRACACAEFKFILINDKEFPEQRLEVPLYSSSQFAT